MALFPRIEHRMYNYTFLLNTFAALHFEERNGQNCGAGVKDRLKDFLMDNFNTDGIHNYPDQSLQVESDDHVITYEFAPTYALVKVGRPQYTTFGKSMLPHVARLRRFVFKVLGLGSVMRVDVRKISLLPIMIEGEQPTVEVARKMMGKILSDDVLSLVTLRELTGVNNSVGPYTLHLMEDKETQFKYEILLGLVKDVKRENIYNVVLDARCSYAPAEGIGQSDVEDKLSDMSRSLYDLYHWAVRQHVIDFMRGTEANG